MQTKLGTVALNCLKIGGAGTLLSAPLALVSLAAGEAAYAGGIATMLVAGAVASVTDRRETARLTSVARRVMASVKDVGGLDVKLVTPICGGHASIVHHMHISG
jgi:hypothetical protein